MKAGRKPYRDFELLVSPAYPYILQFISNFVGLDFLSLRIVGLLLMGIIGVCVLELVEPLTGWGPGSIIAVAVTAYLQSGTAFIAYDYVYWSIAFLLLAFVLQKYANKRHLHSATTANRLLVLAGVSMGISSSIKQTQGVAGIVLGLCSLFLLSRGEKTRVLASKFVQYVGGILVVWLFWVVFLVFQGVDPTKMASQAFPRTGTKGSLFEILFGTIRDVAFAPGPAFVLIIRWGTPLILVTLAVRQVTFPARYIRFAGVLKSGGFRSGCIALVLAFMFVSSVREPRKIRFSYDIAKSTRQYLDTLLTVGPVILCLVVLVFIAIGRLPNASIFIPSLGASIAIVWACGMSAGITESGAFLPFGFMLAIIVYVAKGKLPAVFLISLLSISLLATSIQTKVDTPFAWWGYGVAPTREASATSQSGLTRGLHLPPQQLKSLSNILTAISTVEGCDGEIIVYPHMPLFILDSGEVPFGGLATYWYDFSSQDTIRAEIQRIESVKIKAMVLVDLPESVVRGHEELFNEGARLPHRDLFDLLTRISETQMTAVDKEDLGNGVVATVYTHSCSGT